MKGIPGNSWCTLRRQVAGPLALVAVIMGSIELATAAPKGGVASKAVSGAKASQRSGAAMLGDSDSPDGADDGYNSVPTEASAAGSGAAARRGQATSGGVSSFATDEPVRAESVGGDVDTPPAMTPDPATFDAALYDYYAGDYAEAAAGFRTYMKLGDAAADRYEWAQFFLGESLQALGFWHGAVQYYVIVAKTRSRPEILPEALSRLQTIASERPISEQLVFEDLLYDSDFGTLPDAIAQWVNYEQGLADFRHDFLKWGGIHFDRLPKDSVFRLKSDYVIAVHNLKQNKDAAAVEMLRSIANSSVADVETKNQAHLSLARLLFDLSKFAEAQDEYDKVAQTRLSFEQARLLLEKAWVAYNLLEHRKAMGYLRALEAPSYQRFFLPDAYVLRALIFKDLCHYISAKRVIRSFRSAYGKTLERMRNRQPLETIRRVLDGATQDGTVARRTAFIVTLEQERRRLREFAWEWSDSGLIKHLQHLYDNELREQGRQWRIDFDESSTRVARELLDTEQQLNLLDYEVGLDIFKRLKAELALRSKEESLLIPYDSANVYYDFDGEFWNDELHSYTYYITSRCFDIRDNDGAVQ